MTDTRQCVTCGETKALGSFLARPWAARRYRQTCSVCAGKESARRHYLRYAERCKADGAAYRARPEVHERRKKQAREYRLKMRTHRRRKLQEWRKANPEAARLQNIESAHVRRCRKAGVEVERFNRNSIFVRDKGLCAHCKLGLDPQCWHMDHVVPIARAGGHTRANVVASCPTCNLRKGARYSGVLEVAA